MVSDGTISTAFLGKSVAGEITSDNLSTKIAKALELSVLSRDILGINTPSTNVGIPSRFGKIGAAMDTVEALISNLKEINDALNGL